MKSQLSLFALFLALTCNAQTTVSTVTANGLREPFGVVVNSTNNAFISDSGNNRIVRINASTGAQTTLAGIAGDPPGSNDGPSYAAHFNNPQGLLVATWGGQPGLVVTDSGNNLIRFVRFSDGTVFTMAGQTTAGPAANAAGTSATFRYPNGLAQDGSGNVYIADWGNNTIRVLNLADPALGVTNLTLSGTTLNRPTALAFGPAGAGQLWVADTGNETIKLITLTTPTAGALTTYVGTPGKTGTNDALFGATALFNAPGGLLWVDNVGLLISDTLNNSIRVATNNPILGPTNYSVFTFAGTPGLANGALVNGGALSAQFNSPAGLANDLDNAGFLVADVKNNALRRIQNGPPLPPVSAPVIGWVKMVLDVAGGQFISSLQTSPPFLLDNPSVVAIETEAGCDTHYTWGKTPTNPLDDSIPDPSPTYSMGTVPPYQDGLTANQLPPTIIAPSPDITVKAISFQAGRLNSPVVSARFQFKTADPQVLGNNAANFSVTDQSAGAAIYYTTDGSDPSTNSANSVGPIASGTTIALNAPTGVVFKSQAFLAHFQPSDVVSNVFLPDDFIPNSLTFGFASGEASSAFVASPGQTFYAPVSLTLLSNATIYSLQFDVTITNIAPGNLVAVAPGTYGFQSTLTQPNPANPGTYMPIDPGMYVPSPSGDPIQSLEVTNVSHNMLSLGWLERPPEANLYPASQDLIATSQAHDTVFSQASGKVILGEYTFLVPANAANGQTWQLQLSLPSATSDGIGAPGSGVIIDTITNSTKTLTLGQRKYLVGDAAPFHWFNAGEFGDTNLDNSDVMQVFQSAVYLINKPPTPSDLFDSMDSCGYIGVDGGNGYLTPTPPDFDNPMSTALLYGNDNTTINQIAFGDGMLDVCDVYVTFRRSLDPSLTWFQRFWTNGARAAAVVSNSLTPPPMKASQKSSPKSSPKDLLAQSPSVNFATADFRASPGQTLQVPVTAQIFGPYPLRVLMLGLSVNPLDGSPPLTSPVQFTPNPALGQPTLATGQGVSSYAGTWLDSAIAGFTNTASLGTLTFQIPPNATPTAAYAIHFDHASASPNGLASFPNQKLTGLVTLSDRSASTCNDAIPDSWRLRYFGTVSNLLSQASADADGDGASNWDESLAGTDPTDSKSCLRISNIHTLASSAPECVVRWPSVLGKQYILESSLTPFAPNWIPVSTNSGSGADVIFQDTSRSNTRFYRVRLAP